MPKQFNLKINQFDKGLITEASPLNFPEGASVAERNLLIAPNGTRERRLGMEFENGYALVDCGFSKKELDGAMISYLDWDNAMNNPDLHIGCVVIRDRVFFFNMNTPNPSANILNRGVYILLRSGVNARVHGAYINGFLVLTSSVLEYPIYLEYDVGQDIVSVTNIELKIRDLQGVDDGLPLRERPTTLSLEHKYNLINQGWTNVIETIPDGTSEIQYIQANRGVGGDSGNATWGGVTFYVDEHAPGNGIDWVAAALNNKIFEGCNFMAKAEVVGGRCIITFDPRDGARPQYDFTAGRCLWNDCAISSGRIQSGTTTPYSDVHSYLKSKLGTYASNCDIVSLGLVPSSDSLYYNKFDINVFQKNTGYLNLGEAPKGHIIIDAKNRADSRNSIVPGVASDYDTGSVSVCCGHAGRVFYAGVQGETVSSDARTINSHSIVYFTQIITDKTKLERCYQENDPTDQRQFELAAGDGGTIFIPGCANVVALKSYGTSVLVFSEFGVWEITGGDAPFAATRYSVNKVAQVSCISPDAITEVGDNFTFWAKDGIYVLSRNQYGHIVIQNITKTTIQSWYNSIEEKKNVRGIYEPYSQTVRWLVSSGGEAFVGDTDEEEEVPDSQEFSFSRMGNQYPDAFLHNDVFVMGMFGDSPNTTPKYYGVITKDGTVSEYILTSDSPLNSYHPFSVCHTGETSALFAVSMVSTDVELKVIDYSSNTTITSTMLSTILGVSLSGVSFVRVRKLVGDTYICVVKENTSWNICAFSYSPLGGFSLKQGKTASGLKSGAFAMIGTLSSGNLLITDGSFFVEVSWDDDSNTLQLSPYKTIPVASLPFPPTGNIRPVTGITQAIGKPDTFYCYGLSRNSSPYLFSTFRLEWTGGEFQPDSYCQEFEIILPEGASSSNTNPLRIFARGEDVYVIYGLPLSVASNVGNSIYYSNIPSGGIGTAIPDWKELFSSPVVPASPGYLSVNTPSLLEGGWKLSDGRYITVSGVYHPPSTATSWRISYTNLE